MPESQMEHERAKAMGYLINIADRLNDGPGRWRCEVAVSNSVADEIVYCNAIALHSCDNLQTSTGFGGQFLIRVAGSQADSSSRRKSSRDIIVAPNVSRWRDMT